MATTRHSRKEARYPRRGEIHLATLDPTVGREIQKTRPVLVIQNDVANRLSGMTIVAPITSTVRLPLSPVHVLLSASAATGLSVTSVAVFSQVRAIDRIRLHKSLGAVDDETMALVDQAIKISVGLIRLRP